MSLFYSIGVSRHRLGSDGVGVTTLVGGHGCPLDCKYCLNPQCKRGSAPLVFSVQELYDKVKIDDLYFEATGGGVTFGGGEPLLQWEFIKEFIEHAKGESKTWRFCLETCAAVPPENLHSLDGLIDEYFVDIKDLNPAIYSAYTGLSRELLMKNLRHLAVFQKKVTIKLPLIKGYNCEGDVISSETALRDMGFCNFQRLRYITDIKK